MAIPILWPAGAWVEKTFFPVIRNVEITAVHPAQNGIMIELTFDKVRSCEFLGVVWYNGPLRVGVERNPNSPRYPKVLAEGPQAAGPWLIRNVSDLEGTHAITVHRCHPLWETISHFYP